MITLPRSPSSKDYQKDQDRLTCDIRKICGRIAKRLLNGLTDKAFELSEYEIQSNGTMSKKSIRLLDEAGVIGSFGRAKGWAARNAERYNFEKLFFDHSKDYMLPYDPPAEPQEITSYLKNRHVSSFGIGENTFEYIGYTAVNILQSGEAIYVYWNKDAYDIQKRAEIMHTWDKKIKIEFSVFPKIHLVQRQKAILKMLVKKYSETDFKGYLEKKVGANFDGQIEVSRDTTPFDPDPGIKFEVELRNFMMHPATFCIPDKTFFSTNGYVPEYKEKLDKFSFEYKRLKVLVEWVHNNGGCKAISREYVQESLNDIVSKAPLLLGGDEGDTLALQYILDNRENFTYDYIYS